MRQLSSAVSINMLSFGENNTFFPGLIERKVKTTSEFRCLSHPNIDSITQENLIEQSRINVKHIVLQLLGFDKDES